MKKKKILVDLDVVTVSIWDKKGLDFINRIEGGEFEVYTPYALLDLVLRWNYKELVEEIRKFYELYSDKIITARMLEARIEELGVDNKSLNKDLVRSGVKDEDAILTVITSIFRIEYLVTYNRKHLKNKEDMINNLLSKYRLKTIKIALPSEL